MWWYSTNWILLVEQPTDQFSQYLWSLQNIKTFWDKVESRDLLDLTNLIIVGDLNFTTSSGEIWGASATQDPLAKFFNSLFLMHSLVDFPPDVLTPTWRNGQSGNQSPLQSD
jgi:hypothetical protein